MRGKTLSGLTMAVVLLASLLMISPISTADPLARMYLYPSSATVDQGSTVDIDVYVENVADMYAWEFKVKIDTTVLTLLKPPIEGPFLSGGGVFPTFFAWTFNPQSGVLMVGCTRLGLVPGVSGTGKIATVRVIADEPGATTIIDLFDEKKYDSNLMLIPEDEPGDSEITIQWPPELWDTELWLSSGKGGKIWTLHQTMGMEWDPFYNAYYLWELNTVYCRIRNTGTAGVYVRVWLTFISETGVSENWDPWNDIPLTTMKGYCPASGDVVVEVNCGLVDPYFLGWMPDALALEPGKFNIEGQIQVSMDSLRWYNWGDFDPALPGWGFSKVVPGEGCDMFKVFP